VSSHSYPLHSPFLLHTAVYCCSDFEDVTDPSLIPRVSIHNLVKRYKKGKDASPAVDNLNLTLYESQITCLLGHNGAGKSSTISVLTGLYPPTSGDCVVYGNSVTHNLAEARHSLGICPQQSVLFDRLTVLEHIALFQRIKGMRPTRQDTIACAMETDLGEFLLTTASALSGGNKRKLSVAIALCGDPELLVLDEFSSGMDAAARRSCWDLLRKKRQNRVILLSTHIMEEAEILGDRIAVMKEGKLQCCGSGLFLKNRYGLGYNLTVVLNASSTARAPRLVPELEVSVDRVEQGVISGPDVVKVNDTVDRILQFLKEYIPGTKIAHRSAREVTFRFPHGSEQSFPSTFDRFGEARDQLGVEAYGVSNSTLEEVFLQLAGHQSPENEGTVELDTQLNEPVQPEVNGGHSSPLDSVSVTSETVASRQLKYMGSVRQIGLLLRKRWTYQKRDLKGAFFMIALPVLLIALVLLILMIDVPLAGPAIEMSVDLYRNSPSGSRTQTDVVVGGGASLLQEGARESAISDLFTDLSDVLHEEYRVAAFHLLRDSNSSHNISQYLLDTYNDHTHNARYGAYALEDIIEANVTVDWDSINEDVPTFFLNSFVATTTDLVRDLYGIDVSDTLNTNEVTEGAERDNVNVNASVSVLHNSSSPHAIAAFNQAYMEYLYKNCSSSPASARLVSINHPLPLTAQQSLEIKVILSVLTSLFLLIPYCYIPAAFIIFIVKERVCKSKHLQLVSGVNMTAFWASTYLWDLSLFLLLTVLIMLVFLMYGTESAEIFVGDVESFFCTMILTFGYGMSGLPFAYLLSRMFNNHSSAQIAVMGIFFITGFVATNAYFIMDSIETTKSIAAGLRPLFRTWPAYNVGDGMIEMSNAFWER